MDGLINTNNGAKLYICATATPGAVADLAAYQALTWVQVKGVGSVGSVGNDQNILKYDTWDSSVVLKGKGMIDAGSPDVELARNPADPGQIAMNTAAIDTLPYPIKILKNDKITEGGAGTELYYRALIVGPKRPQGKNEDFDLETFTLGMVQKEIKQDAT